VETRLPLEDEGIYNKVVKGIVDLNLNKKAEENGSNELAKKIRKSVLIPFHFLRESPITYTHRRTETKTVSSNHKAQSQETKDRPSPHSTNPQQSATASLDELQPTTHDIGQQFGTKQSNTQQVLKRSHDPAVDALILLRNSPEQSAKRTRANPSRADQLSDATSYYIVASNPDSSNTVNGFGEDNGASAAQLPQQDQLQGESPIQLASTNIIQGANVSTRGLDTAPVGRYELVLGQAYDTSSDNVNDGPDVRFGNPDPHYSFASSQPVVQNVHAAPQGSLEANNHIGATCGSVAPLVLPDANTQQPARGFMQNLSLENATHPALHGRNPVMNNDLTIDQSQSNIHRESDEGNGASAAQLPQQDTSNDATGGNLDTGWMHTAANAIDSQWDSMDPNALWVHNGASAIESQWDPMNPNAVWMHNGAGAIESQWDPMNPNLMGAFVLNGIYR